MQVILADEMGMCFGVRDALALMRRIEHPAQVTIRGQLVHNGIVLRELEHRGFHTVAETDATLPGTDTVLITAHGISNAERSRLRGAGKNILDTSCPLVRRAHAATLDLQRRGYFVLVIGKPNHVEIHGLTGDLHAFDIIETANQVRTWPHAKLGIVAQTTSVESEVLEIVRCIRAINLQAEVRFVNTICQPTRDRQAALERLLQQVDVLVVVGGRNSNNTLHLVERAHHHGIRALHIQDETELHEHDFAFHEIVGLTAGTSTLSETIQAVHHTLESFHSAPITQSISHMSRRN